MKNYTEIYQAAIDADNAFQRALVAQYGKRAGDMRYAYNLPGPIMVLANKKKVADEALHLAMLRMRDEIQ